jgi:hypothetical protein
VCARIHRLLNYWNAIKRMAINEKTYCFILLVEILHSITYLSLEQLNIESLLVNQQMSLTLSSCPLISCEYKSLFTTLYNNIFPLSVPNANSSNWDTSSSALVSDRRLRFFFGEPFVWNFKKMNQKIKDNNNNENKVRVNTNGCNCFVGQTMRTQVADKCEDGVYSCFKFPERVSHSFNCPSVVQNAKYWPQSDRLIVWLLIKLSIISMFLFNFIYKTRVILLNVC